ncbi:Beta-glucosidase [Lacticaseibacillus paracasei]|nr:Beta-glucosidase [Lacticaseibacillus paracasei]
MLPLQATDTVAVIGELAKATRFQGAGSSHINASEIVSVLDGLKQKKVSFDYAAGYRLDDQDDSQGDCRGISLGTQP